MACILRGILDRHTVPGARCPDQRAAEGVDGAPQAFFEQAIELSTLLEHSPAAEAQVYLEYGRFRERFGQREEARAYLERARETFDSLDEAVARERVEAESRKPSA